MKIAFAGTPRFGAQVLEALIASPHEIVAVFTQPDRPAGRGLAPRMSPVKQLALAAGLRVEQPAGISMPGSIALLKELGARFLTIAAFGQILKENLLDAVPCINVHGSLLPEYRGAAPVERAIMDGKRQTGVSIMDVVLALDSGDVYLRKTVPIEDADDAGSIYEKLARAGGEALVEVLNRAAAGPLVGEPQDESLVTYAGKIGPAERRIDWSQTARQIFNQVRALSPHIGAHAKIGEAQLKIWKTALSPAGSGPEHQAAAACARTVSHEAPGAGHGAPGSATVSGECILVSCADGLLELLQLQPQGKRRMSAAEFLRGYRRLVEGMESG